MSCCLALHSSTFLKSFYVHAQNWINCAGGRRVDSSSSFPFDTPVENFLHHLRHTGCCLNRSNGMGSDKTQLGWSVSVRLKECSIELLEIYREEWEENVFFSGNE